MPKTKENFSRDNQKGFIRDSSLWAATKFFGTLLDNSYHSTKNNVAITHLPLTSCRQIIGAAVINHVSPLITPEITLQARACYRDIPRSD